jgi:hypothetical protein
VVLACTQIVAITLLALVLAEDSFARKAKYDAVVSALRHLPNSVRQVRFLLLRVPSLRL